MLADIIADEPVLTGGADAKNGTSNISAGRKGSKKQEPPEPLNLKEMIKQMRANSLENAPRALSTFRPYCELDEVIDHLYLSGISGRTLTNIRKYKLTLIVNASVDLSVIYVPHVENLKLWVSDLPCTDIRSRFDEASDKIQQHLVSQGGNVLVHCQAGISRSTTIVLAFLIKHRGLSLREAYFLAQKCRPTIRPNPGFWKQLKQYEREMTGKCTVEDINP